MTTLDGIDALAGLIRRQVQALRRGSGVAEGARAGAAAAPVPHDPARRGGVRTSIPGGLAVAIARRVQGIDPTDPDAGRRAFRLFLESVLLLELGEALINDPAFYQLVDDVEGQMRADPALGPLMARAGHLLLERSDTR